MKLLLAASLLAGEPHSPPPDLPVRSYQAVSCELQFGPLAEKNHNSPDPLVGCDPDFGWSDGAEGSGKCYMLIKSFDYK